MQLLLIRHAIAEDPATFSKTGSEDDLRPLSREGRRKMRRGAKGLSRIVPRLSVLATSPLLRAVDTGRIIAREYPPLEPSQIPHLLPRKPMSALLTWVQSQRTDSVVALVGHEPHLGIFASWLLTGLQESFVELKKGGVILLELPNEVKAGRAKLVWAMKPSLLRRLA